MELVAQPTEVSLFLLLLACSPSHKKGAALLSRQQRVGAPRNDEKNSPRFPPGPGPASRSTVTCLTGYRPVSRSLWDQYLPASRYPPQQYWQCPTPGKTCRCTGRTRTRG